MKQQGWKWLVAVLMLGLLVGILALIAWSNSAAGEGSWIAGRAAGLMLKGLLIGVSLAAWFWTQSLIASRGLKDGQIGDLLHDLTASWNTWLNTHRRAASGLLVASSAGIDLFGLFLIGAGIFGPTLRPFLALLLLFAFRQLCQVICALPAPPRMIWFRPLVPFPSGDLRDG